MRYSSLALLVALCGCGLVPHYDRPTAPMAATWKHESAVPASAATTQDFWQSFHDAQLLALLKQATDANQDLQGGLARIDQARAQAKVASSSLFPQIGVSAGVSRSISISNGNNASPSRTSFSAGPDLAYQVDLWGRYRAAANAADFRTQATIYDQKSLTLITLADVATSYIDYLTLSARLETAEENSKNLADVMRIVDARYQAGAVSGLDQAQQQIEVQNQIANVATLTQQREAALDALAVLTGQSPSSVQINATKLGDIRVPAVKLTKPQDILDQRPDILRAEANLQAANIDIGAARAAFFPSVNLAADGSLLASSLAGPINTAASLGASLSAPLFSGGSLEGNLEYSKAKKQELIATYRQNVLTAQQEVEDALAAYTSALQQQAALTAAHSAATNAYNIARARYNTGADDYVNLLEAQRSLFQANDAEANAKGNTLIAAVNLYQALGGAR